jgi:MSHA biogenesis protein MshE
MRLELKDAVDQHSYKHGRGCTNCNGTGYQGRVGVYEMLEMSFEMVEAANHHDPQHFMKMARQQLAGKTLRSQAVGEVLKGRTTVAEAMRISNQFED